MSLPANMVHSLTEELEKIALRFPVTSDVDDLKDQIKPGDVLITKPRWQHLKTEGPHHMLLRAALVTFQGTPWTHTALYVGNGQVVDPAQWKDKTAVHLVDLADFSKRYHFRVLRVDATPKQRANAIAWAKEQVGKDFDIPHLVRMAFPVKKDHRQRLREENLKAMICSQLISNAYPNQNFGKGRHIANVRPVDILKSSLTKTVAEFK